MPPEDEGSGAGEEAMEFECPECGAPLPAGAAKCESCGLEFETGGGFVCPECGADVAADATGCKACGLQFGGEEEAGFVCPECSAPTRVGSRRLEDGKNVRVCKKCDGVIDKL